MNVDALGCPPVATTLTPVATLPTRAPTIAPLQTGMSHLRDVFLNSLCNFTHLHSPATMRPKNALAFKHLLRVADTVGDHLDER